MVSISTSETLRTKHRAHCAGIVLFNYYQNSLVANSSEATGYL